MDRHIIEKNRYYFLRRKKLTLSFGLISLTLLKSHFPDRKVWIKHWIARRRMQGAHHNLFMELQLEDPMKYRRCLRMNSELFETLVNKVTPLIVKKDTHLRKAISPAERLDRFSFPIYCDEGFPLSQEVLIPYPKDLVRGRVDRRIFNYRLSRPRRCSKNAFGVMANRF
ncbi:LOW QUALITY PROTEIN: Ribonucleoside-diphosphate reductase subunit alpha [Frankliniella fusca]|uniref:Ribonucleoside-diphosphate reductase subunit alpha n=1 Tax=Frankliniella fusca TaxID=407009 RepID=A0AAE1HV75_9NEOP|nr:LOW QUALITY PROTEIN: Ribonucleoside-diphosphate reductase subunit alpha [Frankliniella fusca]